MTTSTGRRVRGKGPRPTADTLKPAQLKLLAEIRTYIGVHGFSPSLQDLADAVGYVSVGGVSYQLSLLAEAGVLRHDSKIPRSIVLTTGPCAHCGCPGSHPDGAP